VVRQHEATHDALTGLANRRRFESRMAAMVESGRLDDSFTVLLLDLDRFKEVNDELGHHVGDQLLAQVGARLQAMEGIDLAARLGGDEFAFILRGAGGHNELVEVGQRLVNEVSQPYVVADLRLGIGASIGIATYPDHGLDASSLLRRADSAMYSAKRCRVPVGIATTSRSETLPGRVSLLGELEEAITRGQLKLDYQPKVNLSDGSIVGVESLLRWHHPEHGLVPPDAFVSTAEHTELIAPLTRHVLDMAMEDVARWRLAGVSVPIAVNISTRDLRDRRFPRDLAQLLERHGFDPKELTLEITEAAVQIEPERAGQVLAELREIGVALSIDDFGTGYSSLAALRQLPVTELKIDRTFVLGMSDADGTAIVHSVIQLAHALGLEVVAEGVEEESDLRQLRRLGCDVAQGFLLSRPLPAHLVPPWVRARRQELEEARGPFSRPIGSEDDPPAVRIEAV
jgi:diguanylate cyclase (GGDEF)-like protein